MPVLSKITKRDSVEPREVIYNIQGRKTDIKQKTVLTQKAYFRGVIIFGI
jgi:hypothetical protein